MVSFIKKFLLIGALFGLLSISQAQESCQICLEGTPTVPGGRDGICFMARVGTEMEQAPFAGSDDGFPATLSSFTYTSGGFCQDCIMTAYSSNNFGGFSTVLDFSQNFEFNLNFCAKSFKLACTRVNYPPPGEEEEEEEEEQGQED